MDSVKNGSHNIRKHFTSYMVDGKVFNKEKVGYSTDKEAIERARVMNCRKDTIHKLVVYKCPIFKIGILGEVGKFLLKRRGSII